MKRIIGITLLIVCLLALSSCGHFDLTGLVHSGDVDDRFRDNASLPAKGNLDFSDSVFSFIVISDTHLANGEQKKLAALKDKVLPGDKFILVCGDISQCGYLEDYQAFCNLMNQIGLPYYTAIGNHDLYFSGWHNYKQTLGRSCYSVSLGPIRLIAIDSANGTLGRLQKIWLESVLQSKTESLCLVMTHFEFFSPGKDSWQQYNDIEEVYYLMHLFETAGVDYVFMGHSHRYDYRQINNVNYLTVPDFEFEGDGISKLYIRVKVAHGAITFQELWL